ncbi:unnamed protein product [Trifolium pratense]|uniref:Uncharacterized protein n=1 Tax=Trifolium pratense TaxID=57577 RepID=A0ACB0J817_TRIPR|nr:unnamed protein product [Trifolium pratense]
MAQIVKLVNVIIIFLSLFLVARNVEGIRRRKKCYNDFDCPRTMCPSYLLVKCIVYNCKCCVIGTYED